MATKTTTPWGPAIDFRREQVRQFFTENALYWLMEYRFDGLRFDAAHAIGNVVIALAAGPELRRLLERYGRRLRPTVVWS